MAEDEVRIRVWIRVRKRGRAGVAECGKAVRCFETLGAAYEHFTMRSCLQWPTLDHLFIDSLENGCSPPNKVSSLPCYQKDITSSRRVEFYAVLKTVRRGGGKETYNFSANHSEGKFYFITRSKQNIVRECNVTQLLSFKFLWYITK